jgi:hypothetical protein
MPMAASVSASPANSATRNSAKRGVETLASAMSSIGRMFATASVGSSWRTACRNPFASRAGSELPRITTAMLLLTPTGDCSMGHQSAISAVGLSGLSFTSPTMPTMVIQSCSFGVVVDRDALAERVFIGPITASHALVDDQGQRRFHIVAAGEEPAADQRNAGGAKVAGAGDMIARVEILAGGRLSCLRY